MGPRNGVSPSDTTNYHDAAQSTERSPLLGGTDHSSSPPSAASPPLDLDFDPTVEYVKSLQSLPWYKRPSVYWLLPIMVLMTVTGGMLISSIGQFQASLLCREYMNRHPSNSSMVVNGSSLPPILTPEELTFFNSAFGRPMIATKPADECRAPEIQAFTAQIMAMNDVLSGIACILSIGYYTSMSDRVGRMPIIALAGCSNMLTLTAYIFLGTFWDEIGLPLMISAQILQGLLGGVSMGATMAMAYIADTTFPVDRAMAFGWMHCALFGGLTVGPLLGGLLAAPPNTILVIIYVDLVVAAVGVFMTVFIIPESLPTKQSPPIRDQYLKNMALQKAARATSTSSSASNSAGDVSGPWYRHALRPLLIFKPNGENTNLILLGAISFLMALTLKGTISVIILYTFRRFGFSELEVGILFSTSSLVRLLSLVVLLPLLIHGLRRHMRAQRARKEKKQELEQRTEQEPGTSNGFTPKNNDNNHVHISNDSAQDPNPWQDSTNDVAAAASIEQLGEATLDQIYDSQNEEDEEEEQDDDEPSEIRAFDRRRHSSNTTLVGRVEAKTRTGSPKLSPVSSRTSGTTSNTKNLASTTSAPPTISARQIRNDQLKLDTWIIRLGLIVSSVTFFLMGLANSTLMFYVASGLHAICIIASPNMKSLMTMMVDPSKYGAVLGAFQLTDQIASVLSPLCIAWVYAATVGTRPELVWYVIAAWMGLCVILSFLMRQSKFRSTSAV